MLHTSRSPWVFGFLSVFAAIGGATASLGACSDAAVPSAALDAGNSGGTGGARPGAGGSGGGIIGGAGDSSVAGTAPGGAIVEELPVGFEEAQTGGWKLVGEFTAGGAAGTAGEAPRCVNVLRGVVRDFRSRHPDFEDFSGDKESPGIVQDALGADRKPVYNPDGPRNQTDSKESFDQWYRNDETVNRAYLLDLFLKPGPNGVFTFSSNAYFPLDGDGVGFSERDLGHNFHFTFELHTRFRYKGGEVFEFTGDDDLWVFINRKLALDLGGLHPAVNGIARLDDLREQLGIEVGQSYELDLFHAERHTDASNFRIDTTLDFEGCSEIIDPPIIR